MIRTLPTLGRACVALFLSACLPTNSILAQQEGYQSPNFAGMAAANQQAMFPASPLAGGMAAAQGNEYMDAHGQPIVMPASYCQSCPEGCYGGAGCYPGGGGGFGDPMAVDFGGYGEDQCGPHYFDVSADLVYLSSVDQFEGVGPFGAAGPSLNAPRILNANGLDEDFEPGWRIAARYDIGALALLEATYMGLYDIGFSDQVVSTEVSIPPGQANQLVSIFSDFGQNPIDGLDQGQIYALDYDADLQSTEISYRRYWVGTNPRVSGTWLMGARYFRYTDQLVHGVTAFVPSTNALEFSSRTWAGENDMVGFQFGGDGWICLRQGLRIGCEGKTGIYNNRYKFRNAAAFADAPGVPASFDVTAEGNQVAFASECSLSFVADILPSWSIRGGYQVVYLNSLATAGGNVIATDVSNTTTILTQEDVLMHGFNGGFEYIW